MSLRTLPPRSRRSLWVAFVLVAALLALAGCGGSGSAEATIPTDVPDGAVAVVGSTPVSQANFRHWLAIVGRARGASRARQATVTFLIKAQWLLQEADAEGIDHSVLDKLAAQRIAAAPPPQSEMTPADLALRARLDVVTEALEQRHRKAPGKPSAAAIARYYKANRSQFRVPAARETLMVVTDTQAAALAAKAALEGGRPWAAVATHWSVDASAANGGRYAIVKGLQSPPLVRAAFAARRGRLVGPLRAMPPAGPQPRYYLFKVISETAARQRPLSQATPQIRQLLTEQRVEQALASFERSFFRRWRQRTLCAPGFMVSECGSSATATG